MNFHRHKIGQQRDREQQRLSIQDRKEAGNAEKLQGTHLKEC